MTGVDVMLFAENDNASSDRPVWCNDIFLNLAGSAERAEVILMLAPTDDCITHDEPRNMNLGTCACQACRDHAGDLCHGAQLGTPQTVNLKSMEMRNVALAMRYWSPSVFIGATADARSVRGLQVKCMVQTFMHHLTLSQTPPAGVRCTAHSVSSNLS